LGQEINRIEANSIYRIDSRLKNADRTDSLNSKPMRGLAVPFRANPGPQKR
jgi:hypothetical protein